MVPGNGLTGQLCTDRKTKAWGNHRKSKKNGTGLENADCHLAVWALEHGFERPLERQQHVQS